MIVTILISFVIALLVVIYFFNKDVKNTTVANFKIKLRLTDPKVSKQDRWYKMADKDMPMDLVIDGSIIDIVNADGNPITGLIPTPTWYTSDISNVSLNVSADGFTCRIFPVSLGEAIVSVTIGSVTKTVTVLVIESTTAGDVANFTIVLSDPHVA